MSVCLPQMIPIYDSLEFIVFPVSVVVCHTSNSHVHVRHSPRCLFCVVAGPSANAQESVSMVSPLESSVVFPKPPQFTSPLLVRLMERNKTSVLR